MATIKLASGLGNLTVLWMSAADPGPVLENNEYRRRHNQELYSNIQRVTHVMRKKRVAFYAHLKRLQPGRLTNEVFKFLSKKRQKGDWFKQVEKDMREINLTGDFENREGVKKKTSKHEFKEQEKVKTGTKWTTERKEEHSRKMKEYWAKRKAEEARKRLLK